MIDIRHIRGLLIAAILLGLGGGAVAQVAPAPKPFSLIDPFAPSSERGASAQPDATGMVLSPSGGAVNDTVSLAPPAQRASATVGTRIGARGGARQSVRPTARVGGGKSGMPQSESDAPDPRDKFDYRQRQLESQTASP